MKKNIILILIVLVFSCQKKNKEEWTVFLIGKIENTEWETGNNKEKLIFKRDTLSFYRNDSLLNKMYYKLEGKPPTGLMGYGSLFYFYINKNKFKLNFMDDYKILTFHNYEPNAFFLTSKQNKQEIDTLILNGLVSNSISSRMSIKELDSIFNSK